MKKKDGHIHSPFCPHGSKDFLHEYTEKAIQNGFTEITFTEHAPLPSGFKDPAPEEDSSMKASELADYFQAINTVKEAYSKHISILAGLEVDYIEGFEEGTKKVLEAAGPYIDDTLLSVHFLKTENDYWCMDYSEEVFGELIKRCGSAENVYELYYRTLEKSVAADLGPYKPKRIGHITLARKFQKVHPSAFDEQAALIKLFALLKAQEYQIDFNTAGLRKPNCGETYPPLPFAEMALSLGISLVYGSDAHTAKEVGAAYDVYQRLLNIR
ncbi:histidinol-phosphatase HisJ [Metabacillus sp. RGM 3146]|uniref:histidinol-phosphatase HisJ n=1 Tax=Metabacillus sp. RGM 3146 TaxID=3401092 RepID=UPI003B99309D